jgi:hypothetical protein
MRENEKHSALPRIASQHLSVLCCGPRAIFDIYRRQNNLRVRNLKQQQHHRISGVFFLSVCWGDRKKKLRQILCVFFSTIFLLRLFETQPKGKFGVARK